MTEWEDKKQELIEFGADEDEIAFYRGVYEGGDGRDWKKREKTRLEKLEDSIISYTTEDQGKMTRGELPTKLIWSPAGPICRVKDAEMEDIELALGQIIVSKPPTPGLLVKDSWFDQDFDKDREDNEKSPITKIIISKDYAEFLINKWQELYEAKKDIKRKEFKKAVEENRKIFGDL